VARQEFINNTFNKQNLIRARSHFQLFQDYINQDKRIIFSEKKLQAETGDYKAQ
jgi:hypothetical protein